MRGDHRDHTSGAEDEPLSTRLPDSIPCFFSHLSRTFVYQGILSHAAARYAREELLRLG